MTTEEDFAELLAEIKALRGLLGAGVVPQAKTGHNRVCEEVVGFVRGARMRDDQPLAWLYGQPHLEFKVGTVWEEHIPGSPIEELFENAQIWQGDTAPTRGKADGKKVMVSLPRPVYAVFEIKEGFSVDSQTGEKKETKKKRFVSFHDSPVTDTPEQTPVHHRSLTSPLQTARQRMEELGSPINFAVYPELSDIFSTPATLAEVIKRIVGDDNGTEEEITAAVVPALHFMAWEMFYKPETAQKEHLAGAKNVYTAIRVTAGGFSDATQGLPDAPQAAQSVSDDQDHQEQEAAVSVGTVAPNESTHDQSGDDEFWQEALAEFESVGLKKYGQKWGGKAGQRSKAIAWAMSGFSKEAADWEKLVDTADVNKLPYSILVGLAERLGGKK